MPVYSLVYISHTKGYWVFWNILEEPYKQPYIRNSIYLMLNREYALHNKNVVTLGTKKIVSNQEI